MIYLVNRGVANPLEQANNHLSGKLYLYMQLNINNWKILNLFISEY